MTYLCSNALVIFMKYVQVSMRDWRMTFLPQFKMCVEAGTYSMMCSYNRYAVNT